MRNQEEIVARIRAVEERDFFGTERSDLIHYLEFAHAKPFIKDEVTEAEWLKAREEIKSPRDEILKYLPFAWDKANGCRGLSAQRSLAHFKAWVWLDGQDKMADSMEEYDRYGKKHLVTVSQWYEFNWRAADDNHWRNHEGESGISADQALAAH